jgi:hypothetical protein
MSDMITQNNNYHGISSSEVLASVNMTNADKCVTKIVPPLGSKTPPASKAIAPVSGGWLVEQPSTSIDSDSFDTFHCSKDVFLYPSLPFLRGDGICIQASPIILIS